MEKSARKKPCAWLSDQGWEDVIRVSELFPEEFGSLASDLEDNPDEWKAVSKILHTEWSSLSIGGGASVCSLERAIPGSRCIAFRPDSAAPKLTFVEG